MKILSVSPEGKSICPSSRPNPSRNARSRPDRPGPRAVVPAPRSGGRSPLSGTGRSGHAAPAEPSFEDKLKQFMTQSDSKQVGAEPLYGGEGAAGAGEDN